MTDDEKRQQKAMLLLEHQETRQELEHLRTKAWNISEQISDISYWLRDAREMDAPGSRERERNEKISRNLSRYREIFNFDSVLQLRDELKRTNEKLHELDKQRKALGLA